MAAPQGECDSKDSHRERASEYAARLLDPFVKRSRLGREMRPPAHSQRHPALEWARSGAMALTGPRDGAPQLAPGQLTTCCHAAGLALRGLSLDPWPVAVNGFHGVHRVDGLKELDAPALLGERAAITGLARLGATSPGGSCRFVRCSDGFLAVNLARPDDRASLPAWLAESAWQGDWPSELSDDLWQRVSRAARECKSESLVARARLLGLAVARAGDPLQRDSSTNNVDAPWCRLLRCGASRPRLPGERPLVVDLSALWAGPLCSHLLSLAGARVIKVESISRPDGARAGPSEFFDLMNGGKQSVALDFALPADLQALRSLLGAADIVIESARPRALRQLGIVAENCLRETPGQVWLAITGYGRKPPEEDWVAFGDDAAVAGGLTLEAAPPDEPGAASPMFCGDAIADPLTGLHAAVAAMASWRSGGGVLLDVALRNVVAHARRFGPKLPPASVEVAGASSQADPASRPGRAANETRWRVSVDGECQSVLAPRARPAPQRAAPLGHDTARVLQELASA